MRSIALLLLCLLWSLVEIQSQIAPYITFLGTTLPNHSYVDLSQVGNDRSGSDSDTVQCHTDLITCCRVEHGLHRGDWFAPGSDTRLPWYSEGGDIYEDRQDRVVHIRRRNNPTGPTGIYRCVIATNAVHSDSDESIGETVYVGLYTSGGGVITIPGSMSFTVDSDLNGASPQFTLACISTGGPATTVTWTRDSVTVTEVNETVLDNRTTSQYIHTLTVTEGSGMGGLYTCTVANNRPSSASASYTVQVASAPTNLMAVQEGPTSIRVSWSPPTPLGDTTGYRIYYSGGSSGSVNVSDGSTDNYLLTGLQNRDTDIYTISVVATSQHFHSDTLVINFPLFPGQPSVNVTSTTSTSISLSWSVPSGSLVTSYEVMWQRDASGECPDEGEGSTTITDDSTSYEIMGLEEDSSYTLTVTVANAAGSSAVSETAMTEEAAPSAAPTSVRESAVTSSSITVQWGSVDCIHHNGDITGYSVWYGAQGSASTQSMSVSGGSVTEATISSLMPSTTYSIQVAAVNSAGIGVYSDAILIDTYVPAPTVNVTSITSTSISLSWSVASGSVVTSYEVMWRALSSGDEANDDGGSGTSGSITSTSYTIQELESNTVYSVTVTVTNAAGSTVTQPIIIPLLTVTQSDSQTDNTAAVTGGVVAVVFIITTVAAVIVIVVLLLRNHRGHYSTGAQNISRISAVDITAIQNEAYEPTNYSEEPTYIEPRPDTPRRLQTKAFTPHSSQPPAGDSLYELDYI